MLGTRYTVQSNGPLPQVSLLTSSPPIMQGWPIMFPFLFLFHYTSNLPRTTVMLFASASAILIISCGPWISYSKLRQLVLLARLVGRLGLRLNFSSSCCVHIQTSASTHHGYLHFRNPIPPTYYKSWRCC